MLGALALSLANLKQELELLSCIIVLLLLGAAVDHTIQGLQVSFILLSSTLIRHVGLLIFSLKTTLVASFGLI